MGRTDCFAEAGGVLTGSEVVVAAVMGEAAV